MKTKLYKLHFTFDPPQSTTSLIICWKTPVLTFWSIGGATKITYMLSQNFCQVGGGINPGPSSAVKKCFFLANEI